MKLIQPATVQRDPSGAWDHPDMPLFDEGDAHKYHAWVEQQGLEVIYNYLESEDDDCPAHAECAEGGTFATWNPAPPAGDGWFMLAIDDTDDGPCVWWARRPLTETAAPPIKLHDYQLSAIERIRNMPVQAFWPPSAQTVAYPLSITIDTAK